EMRVPTVAKAGSRSRTWRGKVYPPPAPVAPLPAPVAPPVPVAPPAPVAPPPAPPVPPPPPPVPNAAPITSSFFCDPDEPPSQKPTAVVAFAIAVTDREAEQSGVAESLKKNETTSAPVKVPSATTDTMIEPQADTVFASMCFLPANCRNDCSQPFLQHR